MNRRTLSRVLAVVVALVAMSPLLIEVEPFGGSQQVPSFAAGNASMPGVRPLASESSRHH